MSFIRRTAFLLLLMAILLCFGTTSSSAQVHITLVGKDSNSAACMNEVKAFEVIAARYPRPANWRFVIVCDDASWVTVLTKLGQYDPRYEVYGSTYLNSGVTYLRGWNLTHTSSDDPSPDRIVAHEEAHIYLHSTNDGKVETLAHQWLKESGSPWTGPSAVTSTEALLSQTSTE
jgi:hypothetical protein